MGVQTILVVEDEFLIRFMLPDSLREIGYQVLEAVDGDEGFDILLSGQAVELIVTDVRMPGTIDGMELTRRSKSLARLGLSSCVRPTCSDLNRIRPTNFSQSPTLSKRSPA